LTTSPPLKKYKRHEKKKVVSWPKQGFKGKGTKVSRLKRNASPATKKKPKGS